MEDRTPAVASSWRLSLVAAGGGGTGEHHRHTQQRACQTYRTWGLTEQRVSKATCTEAGACDHYFGTGHATGGGHRSAS
jgi:hypothetical protein